MSAGLHGTRSGATASPGGARDTAPYGFRHTSAAGSAPVRRDIAVEAPVALEVNGIGLAVMMASPADLEDFAVGFALAEGLIERIADVRSLGVAEVDNGWIVRLDVAGDRGARTMERMRTRVTESACGLCGMESLAALARPLPRVARPLALTLAAVDRALAGLAGLQALGRRTGASHAAALCEADGTVVLVREDVGRHNALDKLIGAAMRGEVVMADRFALMTSRLSFELVEKAVRAGLGGLAAISAPTSLALERAEAAGLPVVAALRDGSMIHEPVAERRGAVSRAETRP